MALPTRVEQLTIAALGALRHGDLHEIDVHLGAALKGAACEPDLVTEEPECKTALLRAVERADLDRVSVNVRERERAESRETEPRAERQRVTGGTWWTAGCFNAFFSPVSLFFS
jgi:hypothetical protein